MSEITIRLDRSKKFSTVHGDRVPGDPHYMVHYWQNDLPFDAAGILVPDDGQTQTRTVDMDGKPVICHPLYNAERRAKVARIKERLAKARPVEDPIEVTADSTEEDRVEASQDVNLESWLRGELNYEPWQLYAAAKVRFSKHYGKLRELVQDLVEDERIVPEDQVAPHLLRLLDQPSRAA